MNARLDVVINGVGLSYQRLPEIIQTKKLLTDCFGPIEWVLSDLGVMVASIAEQGIALRLEVTTGDSSPDIDALRCASCHHPLPERRQWTRPDLVSGGTYCDRCGLWLTHWHEGDDY